VSELLPEAPEVREPRHDPLDDLVCVYASNRMDSEMIRAMLEGNGIPAVNSSAGTGGYPVNVGQLGAGRVLVRVQDEDEALDLIKQATGGDFALPDSEAEPRVRTWRYAMAAFLAGLMLYAIVIEARRLF
jgi:hypothetical protein